MVLEKTITEPARAGRSGNQDHASDATTTLVSERFRIALTNSGGTAGTEELAEQIRKRLRFISLVVAVAFTVGAAVLFLTDGTATLTDPLVWNSSSYRFAQSLLYAAIFGVVGGFFLRPRSGFSLRSARRLEWLVSLLILLFFTEGDVRSLVRYADTVPRVVLIDAMASALPYVATMVGYSVLIPNTTRRCAAVLTVFFMLAHAGGVLGFLVSPQPVHVVAAYLVYKTIWLGIAIAIVVYGAYRIESLRGQAQQAKELGQYRLGQRLGFGGMGEVYLAEHRLLRRPAAIKLIRPDRAGDRQNLLRFEREVQATATLTHPNTVQIYDYGHAEDGTFYYVMEYLPGMTLEQLVKQYGPVPAARAIYFLRQLCGALGEAHAIGLIHRDIKPGNVMVCERGGCPDTVKLLDFGLVLPLGTASEADRLTQAGMAPGTPAYLSPEQASGRDDLDGRSDIYSLGVLAYFILTGRPPFLFRSAIQVVAAHLYEQPEPLSAHCPEVPSDLEAIILRCLAKEPADRFPDVGTLEAALASCRDAGLWSKKEAAAWWRRVAEGRS